MTIEEYTQLIVKWVVRNSWRESVFMTNEPQHNVNSESLIDYLHEVTGISKEQLSKWSNDEADLFDSGIR